MRSWLRSLAAELLPQWMSEKEGWRREAMLRGREGTSSKARLEGKYSPADSKSPRSSPRDDQPASRQGRTPRDYTFPELDKDEKEEAVRLAGNLKD